VMTLFLLCFSVSYADYSIPVEHTHNNRAHTHQLPKEGVLHRHGIGELGKSSQSQTGVIRSTTTTIPNQSTYKPPGTINSQVNSSTAHIHSGRSHEHPLPNQGVYHRHGSSEMGQPINQVKNTTRNNGSSFTIRFGNTDRTPTYTTTRANTSSSSIRRENDNNSTRSDRKWRSSQKGFDKYTKGVTNCTKGKDCNFCASNVQQQFQKAASKQINWNRKQWKFNWPKKYPPHNVRPLDIFDGDPKYALGIPDTHIQGFVKTNSHRFPYAGSHSHKSKGGIFVVNRDNSLSSLHKTNGRHPSGVQVIGKYLVYGEGSKVFFKDLDSKNQDSDLSLRADGANFGGGLGVIKLSKDNHLLITTGPGGQKAGTRYNRFYHLKSRNGRPVSLRFLNRSSTNKPNQWPNIYNYSENMSLVTECGTGDIYAVHTTGDEQGLSALAGRGYWRLSKLNSNGNKLSLTAINAFTTGQDMKRCNVRASATVSVNH